MNTQNYKRRDLFKVALFQYSHEQGLAKKRLTIEDLFHPATLEFEEE